MSPKKRGPQVGGQAAFITVETGTPAIEKETTVPQPVHATEKLHSWLQEMVTMHQSGASTRALVSFYDNKCWDLKLDRINDCLSPAAVASTVESGNAADLVQLSQILTEAAQHVTRARSELRLRRSGLPLKFWTGPFKTDSAERKRCLDVILRWASDFEPGKAMYDGEQASLLYTASSQAGLVISGRVGEGKSKLASILVREAAEENISCYWYMATSLFDRLHAASKGNGRGGETESDIRDEWETAGLIVIDDIAVASNLNDLRQTWLHQLLCTRLDNQQATVFTTNSNKRDLASRIGQRNASRLCSLPWLIMKTREDFRGREGCIL